MRSYYRLVPMATMVALGSPVLSSTATVGTVYAPWARIRIAFWTTMTVAVPSKNLGTSAHWDHGHQRHGPADHRRVWLPSQCVRNALCFRLRQPLNLTHESSGPPDRAPDMQKTIIATIVRVGDILWSSTTPSSIRSRRPLKWVGFKRSSCAKLS